jgi:hypothetical protein
MCRDEDAGAHTRCVCSLSSADTVVPAELRASWSRDVSGEGAGAPAGPSSVPAHLLRRVSAPWVVWRLRRRQPMDSPGRKGPKCPPSACSTWNTGVRCGAPHLNPCSTWNAADAVRATRDRRPQQTWGTRPFASLVGDLRAIRRSSPRAARAGRVRPLGASSTVAGPSGRACRVRREGPAPARPRRFGTMTVYPRAGRGDRADGGIGPSHAASVYPVVPGKGPAMFHVERSASIVGA